MRRVRRQDVLTTLRKLARQGELAMPICERGVITRRLRDTGAVTARCGLTRTLRVSCIVEK